MNNKLFISLGILSVLAFSSISAMAADTTIYTDGIGRMHFLGRDAASSTGFKHNYTNPEQQELTRKLYSENGEVNYDTSYDQHPVKNYENTFPDSKATTSSTWKQKYENNVDAARVDIKNVENKAKGSFTAEKGAIEAGPYEFGNTNIKTEESEKNVIKTSKKKHWWNKK